MPQPPPPGHTPYFVALGDVFSPAELDRIVAGGDSLPLHEAATFRHGRADMANTALRVTRICGLLRNEENHWLYERMRELAQYLNAQVFQFDLDGFAGPFQYAVYRGEEGGHYNWHVDHGDSTASRKLSFTVQLSDPADYEGGELQFQIGDKIDIAARERGKVIAFPSYVLHRVTPVSSGVRRSMVAWCSGPKYR